ncbi:MAG TPA: hypothetical protein VKD26_02060 [Streptosporangiaceae bacterium]|nr:hypothetical protein [Streptosporangiaceae bacterium]
MRRLHHIAMRRRTDARSGRDPDGHSHLPTRNMRGDAWLGCTSRHESRVAAHASPPTMDKSGRWRAAYIVGLMGKRDDLEALSSRELHDRAVHRAVRHMDVAFLWELLRELPAAEAAEGHADVATGDEIKLSALIADALASGKGDLAEGLRPLYITYLEKHGD